MAEKEPQPPKHEVIALPPLRMTLTHANDNHLNKKALVAAIKKYLPQEQQVDPQAIMRIIEFLETISQEK